MSAARKALREFQDLCREFGLQVLEVVQNNHFKITVKRQDGTIRKFVFSVSCSDHRAIENMRCHLRKFAKDTP